MGRAFGTNAIGDGGYNKNLDKVLYEEEKRINDWDKESLRVQIISYAGKEPKLNLSRIKRLSKSPEPVIQRIGRLTRQECVALAGILLEFAEQDGIWSGGENANENKTGGGEDII